MLGLPKKTDKRAASIIEDADLRRIHQDKNGSGLKMTMVGPHMILVPRPEYDRGANWPEATPRAE